MKNETGGTRSKYEREEESIQGFSLGNLRVRDYLEDLNIDGKIMFKGCLKK
jgi:hypothetical protein